MVAVTYTTTFNTRTDERAREYGGLPQNPNSIEITHNDGYDAYRHAMMSAILTDHFGERRAKEWMDQYEKDHPNNAEERNMDLWNNNVGREEYRRWREASERGETTDSLDRWIYDAVKAGKTINDPVDDRSWVEPDEIYEPSSWTNADPMGVVPLPQPDSTVNDYWRDAIAWTPPRDPLAIDLDGDGIETLGVGANPILFDHNADGIKTGTGWLKGDDAWLTLDRDGNSQVDSGRELFGVDTEISVGNQTRTATTGFEALASLDANADGLFDVSDAAFTQVRLWQDLNQDGISSANELSTLSSQGIQSISLNVSTTTTDLGNGNSVTGTATVTRSNGSTTGVSSVAVAAEAAGNLSLVDNPFYREFTDTISWTAAAKALPEMRGSGVVRDLREAMSLGTSASSNLVSRLQTYAAAHTRQEQMALVDELISAWTSTAASHPDAQARQMASQWTILSRSGEATTTADFEEAFGAQLDARGMDWRSLLLDVLTDASKSLVPLQQMLVDAGLAKGLSRASIAHSTVGSVPILEYWTLSAWDVFAASRPDLARKVEALEVFNGQGVNNWRVFRSSPGAQRNAEFLVDTFSTAHDYVLLKAYDALRESVYEGLVVQTRLRPYLDSIELVIDEGIRFDTTALAAKLDAYKAQDERNALIDLIELNHYALQSLQAAGYDSLGQLRTWAETIPAGSTLAATLAEFSVIGAAASSGTANDDIFLGSGNGNTFRAGDGNDIVDGSIGTDFLNGENGDDTLLGHEGDDTLQGGAGDDVYTGGIGNDSLTDSSRSSADIYRFNRGDGNDVIVDHGGIDRIELGEGITEDDVTVRVVGTDLTVNLNTGDSLRWGSAVDYSSGATSDIHALEYIRFANSTTWDFARIKLEAVKGTGAADSIKGFSNDEMISGGAGDDSLRGRDGNDTLLGGAGADWILGEAGNDVLDGGDGDDSLEGGAGNDVYVASSGQDDFWDVDDSSSDTYRFGRGDGADMVHDHGGMDRIELGPGITQDDVALQIENYHLVLRLNTGEVLTVLYTLDSTITGRSAKVASK